MSWWLATALVLLGLSAAAAVLAAELPLALALPAALAAVAYGAWLAECELTRPIRRMIVPTGESAITVDEVEVRDFAVQWRGMLAFLRWRDAEGYRHCLQGWPDNLCCPARRELRLAMQARFPVRSARSVAP